MSVINKIIKRSKEDKGNAVILLGLLLIMVTLLIGGMLLDISKAYQMKSAYVDSARKATQAAVSQQNSEGYLTAEAAVEAMRVYETVARPSVIKDGYMTQCKNEADPATGKRNVPITVYFMKRTSQGFVRGTHSITMNSRDIRTGDSLAILLNRAGVTNNTRKNIENSRYIGVEMELTESTPNVLLPRASAIAGTESGVDLKCQMLGVKAGASQFIGKTNQYN